MAKKKLKVFEAFAGIWAQNKALTNIFNDTQLIKDTWLENKNFEVVITSEWYIDWIIAYDAIHHWTQEWYVTPNKEVMLDFISNFSLSKDSKNLYQHKNIERLSEEKIKQLYIALKRNKNFGSILDIKAKNLPNFDLLTYSFPCFKEWTMISTDSWYVDIKDIKVWDNVLTHKNRFRKVTTKFVTKWKEWIYRIKGQWLINTYATEEHPYYIREVTKKWNNSIRRYEKKYSEPKWKNVKSLKKGDLIWFNIRDFWNETILNNNNPKFYRLLGRLLADGWWWKYGKAKSNRIVLCCSKKEVDEVDNLLNGLYNYSKVEERTVFSYHIVDKELLNILETFWKYSYWKYLPNNIFRLKKELLEELLFWYLDWNWNKKKDWVYRISNVSYRLLLWFQQVVHMLYWTITSLHHIKKPKKYLIEWRMHNHRDIYELHFKLQPTQLDKWKRIGNYIWLPFREKEFINEVNTVYNIEVQDDNSYTANNAIVHNCQDISNAWKQKWIKKWSGTRSGLLWEIERILIELKELNKLPKFLLMENVKALLTKNHLWDFREFEIFLEGLWYLNTRILLNARNFWIPQWRERVFLISELDWKTNVQIQEKNNIKENVFEFLDIWNMLYIDEYNEAVPNDTSSRRKMWKKNKQIDNITSHTWTITTKQDRHPNSWNIEYKHNLWDWKANFRFLTPRECIRLMWFTNEDYDSLSKAWLSKAEIYKQAWNSIVVQKLEAIFIEILKRF